MEDNIKSLKKNLYVFLSDIESNWNNAILMNKISNGFESIKDNNYSKMTLVIVDSSYNFFLEGCYNRSESMVKHSLDTTLELIKNNFFQDVNTELAICPDCGENKELRCTANNNDRVCFDCFRKGIGK